MAEVFTRAFWSMGAKLLFVVVPAGAGLLVGGYRLRWWLAEQALGVLPIWLVTALAFGVMAILFNLIARKDYDTLVAETAARKVRRLSS